MSCLFNLEFANSTVQRGIDGPLAAGGKEGRALMEFCWITAGVDFALWGQANRGVGGWLAGGAVGARAKSRRRQRNNKSILFFSSFLYWPWTLRSSARVDKQTRSAINV